jgi:hypothetical protein
MVRRVRSWAPPATTRRTVFQFAGRSRETSRPNNGFLIGPRAAHSISWAISRSRLAEGVGTVLNLCCRFPFSSREIRHFEPHFSLCLRVFVLKKQFVFSPENA